MKTKLSIIYPLLLLYPFVRFDKFTAYKDTEKEQISYKVTLSSESLYGKTKEQRSPIPKIVFSIYNKETLQFENTSFQNIESDSIDIKKSRYLKQFIEVFLSTHIITRDSVSVNNSDTFNMLDYIIDRIKFLVEEELLC